jgi:hypothetical protein
MVVMNSPIEIIKTGQGLMGSRIGLVFAPPNAAAGALSALTDYLNEQPNIVAKAGYHGPNDNHVLRVSGIPDDGAFLELLKASPVAIAPNAECDPLGKVDHFPHQNWFKKLVKENANTSTGLLYMAGSAALLLAAWRAPKHMPGNPAHDWYRSYTAGAYFAASAILVALSQQNDNPRDVYSILEDVYPQLANGSAEDKEYLRQEASRVGQFVRNHPWEISMLLNASAAGSHAISSYKRGWKAELTGALASLAACTLSAVVPEKGGRSMIPIAEWLEDEHGRGVLQRLEDFGKSHPAHRGWIARANQFADAIQENPLRASSVVSGFANTGYAISGVLQKNPPLTAMAAMFAGGNYTQSQATKGRGDGFDSVVTAAARIIENDADLQGQPPAKVQQRIEQLAERLTAEREIVHPKARLVRGIQARRQGAYLPSEERILRESPFAGGKQQWQGRVEQGGDAQGEQGVAM